VNFPNLAGLLDLSNMPHVPFPSVSYTCCYIQLVKPQLHSNLSDEWIHKNSQKMEHIATKVLDSMA